MGPFRHQRRVPNRIRLCPTESGCAQQNSAVPNGIRLCQTESGIVARTFGESTWAHFRVVSLTAQHASVHSSSAENKGALHFKIFLRIIMNKSKHLRAISMQYLYIFIMHAYAIHVSGRSSTFKSHMRRKYVYICNEMCVTYTHYVILYERRHHLIPKV